MRILVTFAVDAEFAPWRKIRQFERLEADGCSVFSTTIDGLRLDVLLTGIGGKKAWVEATKIVWNGDTEICISSGLAGGLRDEHRPEEVFVARNVHAPSWKTVVRSAEELVDIAATSGAKVVGDLYSSDHVIVLSSDKRELGKVADAVDMESGDVLCEAAAFGAKVVAVRAISDSVEEDLPLDFNRVTTDAGDVSMPRILGEVAQSPGSIPALIRFGRQSRKAAEKLALVLDRIVMQLAAIHQASDRAKAFTV
jgi:adenosylhomocysteine nucleosidase